MPSDKGRVKGNAELRAAVMEDEVGFDQKTTKVSGRLMQHHIAITPYMSLKCTFYLYAVSCNFNSKLQRSSMSFFSIVMVST
jgi:hypothetical protein